MPKDERMKVLMELRPALDGFAGIPQETRLIFSTLNKNLENVEVTGLINHPSRRLWPGLKKKSFSRTVKPYQKAHRLARVAISVKTDPIISVYEHVLHFLGKKVDVQRYSFLADLNLGIRIYDFDATRFGDFIWQSMFSKTLPAREFEMVRNARYASVEPPWDMLNQVSIRKMMGLGGPLNPVRLNTGKYDVFLAQTPFPGTLPRKTQLVVRYHDAIPIYLPHTINNSRLHQHAHMANLLSNQKLGVFACTSAATRADLLAVFPSLEERSLVIPDIVSGEYYEEAGSDEFIGDIIRTHICPDTEPKFLTSREKENFYNRNLSSGPLRYIMMVSTLEPRKNHSKLVAAWDYLRNHGMKDLKLVLVGSTGWDHGKLLEAIAPCQQRGQLFHLHRVPSGQLRILYKGAAAVICPSVAEGFDLSGIEAMLCGGAVIASDIPVHREIYADACVYFDPYSSLAQAKAIESIIHPDSQERRLGLIAAGLKHAVRYKRENIAPHWCNLFEKIRAGAFDKALGKLTFPRIGWWKPANWRRKVQDINPQLGGGVLAATLLETRKGFIPRNEERAAGTSFNSSLPP